MSTLTKLTLEQKNEIGAAMKTYLKLHDLSLGDLSRDTKVNGAYLSLISNGIYESNGAEIGDKQFLMIAEKVGYTIVKRYWPNVLTPQFKEGIALLTDAKEHLKTLTLLCPTGLGKTHLIDSFCNKQPKHTYRVTVNGDVTISHLLGMLLKQMQGENVGGISNKVERLGHKLRLIRLSGGNPIVIFDEMENASPKLIRTMKGLYDAVSKYASIAIIATPQYQRKLDRMSGRDAEGFPQFCRRFKAGTRYLSADPDFTIFFDKLGIKTASFKSLLVDLCNNYGELHDYLEPVLREADKKGVPFDEYLFRLYHNLPNR